VLEAFSRGKRVLFDDGGSTGDEEDGMEEKDEEVARHSSQNMIDTGTPGPTTLNVAVAKRARISSCPL